MCKRGNVGDAAMTDASEPFKALTGQTSRLQRKVKVWAVAALVFALAATARAADKLGSFPVDPAKVSVAGISSGAQPIGAPPIQFESARGRSIRKLD